MSLLGAALGGFIVAGICIIVHQILPASISIKVAIIFLGAGFGGLGAMIGEILDRR